MKDAWAAVNGKRKADWRLVHWQLGAVSPDGFQARFATAKRSDKRHFLNIVLPPTMLFWLSQAGETSVSANG